MKNLKIKKTIWQTYKAEIKFMLFISLALCTTYVLYLNAETIKILFIEISDILDSLFARIGNWLSLVFNSIRNAVERFLMYYFDTIYIYISIVITIIFIVRYFIFIYRQQYIPLTKEEMEANNITDVYEYFSFLSNLLLGHIPRRCLIDIKTSTNILSESQNIKNESQICWIKSKLESSNSNADSLIDIFRKIFRKNHKTMYIFKICLQIIFFINLVTLLIMYIVNIYDIYTIKLYLSLFIMMLLSLFIAPFLLKKYI